MRTKKTIRMFLALFFLVCMIDAGAPVTGDSPAPAVIKTLIITGQHNHNWKVSSAVLEKILENSGLFDADIATSPPKGGNMAAFSVDFAPYRLVVLDYNGDEWPAPMKKAFVEFVRSGGGVVVYHAADNAFPEWPEYNQIIGLGFGGERDQSAGPYVFWNRGQVVRENGPGIGGYHGDAHDFEVINRDISHPLTEGLPEKWMHAADELYSLMRGPGENLHILATAYSDPAARGSGRHEPVLFTVGYGKGRVFHTVLGHAMGDTPPAALQCAGFIVTFLRGAEWAATGEVTQKITGGFPGVCRDTATPDDIRLWPDFRPPDLVKILADAASYDFGKDEEVLSRLRDYVRACRNSPQAKRECEKKLAAFLATGATLASKREVCQHLREIGSAVSVPALGKMLMMEETSDMARYTLEKIPGEEAEKALVEVLPKAGGKIRLGIIDSVGNRKARSAVPQLAKIISASDEQAAIASALSLGKIASPGAASALSEAMDRASGTLKERIASSLLRYAEMRMAENETDRAAGIFQGLIQAELPLQVRQAAMRGWIASSEDQARKRIIDALQGKNQEWYAPAIAAVKDFYDTSTIKGVSAFLPGLPAEYQVQLLGVLSYFRDEGVRASVVQACKSPDLSVRIAALEALAKVGNYTVVESLVSRAAGSKGKEQQAARTSLYNLKCGLADQTILTNLVKNRDEAIQYELILAIGERRIKQGLPLILSTARAASGRNRQQAIQSLENVASPSELPAMVELMLDLEDNADRLEMAGAIASVAAGIPQVTGRADAVVDVLQSVSSIKDRCALYRTLGRIGDDSSLFLIRGALQDANPQIRDAAVRAMADWPTPSAKEDLLHIASTSETPVHKVLALQAYIRMMEIEPYQSPWSAVRSFEKVLDIARAEEKKLILGILPAFASPEALVLARTLLEEKELEEEARLAIQKIEKKLKKD